MKNKLCDMLGIEFPLFAFSHCRDVVAAVSKAGGFGVFGASNGHMTVEQLKIELDWIDDHVGGQGVPGYVPDATGRQGRAVRPLGQDAAGRADEREGGRVREDTVARGEGGRRDRLTGRPIDQLEPGGQRAEGRLDISALARERNQVKARLDSAIDRVMEEGPGGSPPPDRAPAP